MQEVSGSIPLSSTKPPFSSRAVRALPGRSPTRSYRAQTHSLPMQNSLRSTYLPSMHMLINLCREPFTNALYLGNFFDASLTQVIVAAEVVE